MAVINGNSGNDDLSGTDGVDTVRGFAGDDVLRGLGAADLLIGGEGNDRLIGGPGADEMRGEDGNDTYVVDHGGDQAVEAAEGGSNDSVEASVSYALPAHVENLRLMGSAYAGTGNSLANIINGNLSDNLLDGRAGADLLSGGLGNDLYVVGSGDRIFESAGAGIDTVRSWTDYTLGANLERLTLIGNATEGVGNSLDNLIIGNSAANLLRGGRGDDVLDGKAGADTMRGGKGDDTYYVERPGDQVVEYGALDGIDTVVSSIGYRLGKFLENLTLAGNAGLDGFGNALDNVLNGNSADNLLRAGDGDDRLDGGEGDDELVGGRGGDSLFGEIGNDLIHGGAGNDKLYGQRSSDILLGGEGDDYLDAGRRQQPTDLDALYGGPGNDTLRAWNDGKFSGRVRYYFNSELDAESNVDLIAYIDLDPHPQGGLTTEIELSQTIFSALPLGQLEESAFHVGESAADADDRIIFNPDGFIYYDSDGVGGAEQIMFARVSLSTVLVAEAFHVY